MKTIVSIMLFLICALHGNAADNKATLECIYRLIYQVDTVTKRSSNAMMVLRRNETKSLFYSQSNFEKDSMLLEASGPEERKAINDSIKARYGKVSVYYYVLEDFDKKELEFVESLPTNSRYTESLPNFSWEITEEQKTIDNYACQKAVCTFVGRTYEAWFAPDIPISDGPWKFYGLPGLILEVYDTKHHYEFQFLGMRPCSGKIEIPNRDVTKTTKKEYLRLKQLAIDDPSAYLDILNAMVGIKCVSSTKPPKLRSYATMERVESLPK
ncbi:GLPGLI family protein [Prevotella sp. oral taxon 317]|uniref:GLPGLI family protein n=1 Tax=Prevotella sp. oral taxon 317 TaxID=652721 RepID=UPI0001C3F742|nr:GLPGLI family protein [Prevotella sp. oral taxon 317]EFC69505.1 conserved hypothetical protein TIGR01200 [Prevotella sp. oral taxon 317 str. F0108]